MKKKKNVFRGVVAFGILPVLALLDIVHFYIKKRTADAVLLIQNYLLTVSVTLVSFLEVSSLFSGMVPTT